MQAYLLARFYIMFGIDGREIVNYGNADRKHLAFAPKWSSKTEDLFISLNVITSCMQSFAHGSNDVANAIGPFATIYFIWQNGKIPGNSSPVEVWQLAFGGVAICLGLALYGYNLMRVLGNNLTYQSPSRGFCMDLGSAITIIIASKEGFPVSTTQCITGATVGVGLANGEWRAVNWWLFAKVRGGCGRDHLAPPAPHRSPCSPTCRSSRPGSSPCRLQVLSPASSTRSRPTRPHSRTAPRTSERAECVRNDTLPR